jgi:hypothetical protein
MINEKHYAINVVLYILFAVTALLLPSQSYIVLCVLCLSLVISRVVQLLSLTDTKENCIAVMKNNASTIILNTIYSAVAYYVGNYRYTDLQTLTGKDSGFPLTIGGCVLVVLDLFFLIALIDAAVRKSTLEKNDKY